MRLSARYRSSSHKRAFTLGEGLFVCALALMGGLILFFVGSKTKNQQLSRTCMYNVRQLGAGEVMYAQDHDDTLPPCTNNEMQIASKGSIIDEAEQLKRSLQMYTDAGVWFCPEDPVARQQVHYLGVRHDISSYVLPKYLDEKGRPKKLSTLPNNIHYGLVWDAAGDKKSTKGEWLGGSKNWASNHSDGTVNFVLPDLSLHRSPALLPSGVLLP